MIPSPSSLRAVELLALSSIFKTPYVRTLRQAVDLPSQGDMKDDECENADYGDWRTRIDQQDNPCCDPQYPEHHAHPANTLAKGRGPEHRHPESNETYRQDEEPCNEQRIEYALGRLLQEDECRLIFRGCSGSMIEVGDRDGTDMREGSGREHAETHNAQDAPEESGREARSPQSSIQGEEVDDPQDEDRQV